MTKRIYEFAKEHNMSSKAILDIASEQGLDFGSHMSSIDQKDEKKLLQAMKNSNSKSKQNNKKEDNSKQVQSKQTTNQNKASKSGNNKNSEGSNKTQNNSNNRGQKTNTNNKPQNNKPQDNKPKDDTTANQKLPAAGLKAGIVFVISIIAIFGIIKLVQYKKMDF